MSEAATAPVSKYWNEAKKKFVLTSQVTDDFGNPVGPPQTFEADTLDELLEKKDAAHRNAAAKLYETRAQVKLGQVLEPDPEEPLHTFEERQLTADEMVAVNKMLNDPAKAAQAHKILLEAQLGAPIDVIRAKFRNLEITERVDFIRTEVSAFRQENPDYVECEANKDKIEKYMTKYNLRWNRKNLKTAFEDLKSSGLMITQVQKAPESVPAPATPAAAEVPTPAPAPTPEIPAAATKAPEIPAPPTEVRPKQSSSGLGRGNSSAAPAGGPKAPEAPGITIRDINKMSAAEYAKACENPEFRKQVEALYAKK